MMKIYSWNVNGIRAVLKKGVLQKFLLDYDPDILCLQETKATAEQVENEFPGYKTYWNSAQKKGYSGTAILTKQLPQKVLNGLPTDIASKYNLTDVYGDASLEGRVLTLEFPLFFVSTVYTPNAKDDLSRIPLRQEWDMAFLSYMKRLQKQKPMIFCGDLNVAHTELDLARPKENKGKKGFTTEERRGLDKVTEAGFVDTFRHFEKQGGYYTWWSHFAQARARNIGWRIDYFFISEVLVPSLQNASIYKDVTGSDHCPVAITLT